MPCAARTVLWCSYMFLTRSSFMVCGFRPCMMAMTRMAISHRDEPRFRKLMKEQSLGKLLAHLGLVHDGLLGDVGGADLLRDVLSWTQLKL